VEHELVSSVERPWFLALLAFEGAAVHPTVGLVVLERRGLFVAGLKRVLVFADGHRAVFFFQVVKDLVAIPSHDVAAQLADVVDQLRVELPVVLESKVMNLFYWTLMLRQNKLEGLNMASFFS
jgi:hypothetical protein